MPPRPKLTVMRSVRTPEALDALRSWIDSDIDATTRDRGTAYFREGAVRTVWSEADHLVRADVQGQRSYEVTLFLTRGTWSSRCTCPVGRSCKHSVAAALAWLAAVEAGVPDGRPPATVLLPPEPLPPDTPPPRPAPLTPAPYAPATTPPSHSSALERELAQWLRALPSPEELAARSARSTAAAAPTAFDQIAGLRVRLDAAGAWHLETRPAPDKPFRGASQKFLNDLSTLRPADLESLAPAEAALASALIAELRLAPHRFAPRDLPVYVAANLLRTRAAHPALALPDGSPLAIEPEPLVPEATPSPHDPEQLLIRLLAPDGRPAETAQLVSTQPEPLYLFENRLWRGPPPTPSPRLPLAALSDTRLLPRLRAVGLRLPASLAANIRHIRLRPQLHCWLSPALSDALERQFHAQLTARADDPPCAQQFTLNGWQWSASAPPPPHLAGEPVREYDLASAHAASNAFASFKLVWDGWAEAWTRWVNDAFPDEFLAWHASLPPDLSVELSPELASLLGAPLEARIDVSITSAPGAPSSNQDWFDLAVGLKVADATLSPDEVALLLKARGKWVHLPRHGWKRLATDTTADAATTAALDRLGLGIDDALATGKPAKHRFHALQLALEAEALAARDTVLVHALQDRARRLAAEPPPPVPSNLRATLRPYQVEGYHFLCHLSSLGFGGILADDMGLGKTVQTLAWLLQLSAFNLKHPPSSGAEDHVFRVLVVCPKSVTHGWLTETARFAPDLGIAAFSTTGRSAKAAIASAPAILVANYTQLRQHASVFAAVHWDAVVLDEAQFIKTPSSQVAIAARSLRASHRLILTGTPIENRLSDLWSLFAFAQPGLLGDQPSFRRQYNEADPTSLARLHRRVRHFLLRRTKAQAAPDLPSRTEDELIVELEPAQRRLYDAELKRARAQLLGVETKSALDAVRFHVLASLLRLRQICCHPALVDPSHATLPSAKLEALIERIEELAEEGHQVLVFSQFVEMLNLIRARLVAANIGHLILTGATENRAELVDTFQTDRTKTVFLLSLKAAGFGLNLTAASYAFLYDPWWNPAAEAQAIDRIHRIGQTKPVIAYRLLAEATIEEKIRLLQREKAALANAVVQEESLATVLDLDSLRRILA